MLIDAPQRTRQGWCAFRMTRGRGQEAAITIIKGVIMLQYEHHTRKGKCSMAVERQKSRTARFALDNGTDSEGNVITVNISLQNISPVAEDWNADKFLAIAAALGPCLSKTMESADTVVTYSVSAGS